MLINTLLVKSVNDNDYSISVQQKSSLPPNVSTKSSNCDRMNLKLHHPQRSIVASLGNGRLGNQMSNFASCYAVMREYGMYPYLNPSQLHALQKVFILPRLSNKENQSYYLWEKGKL